MDRIQQTVSQLLTATAANAGTMPKIEAGDWPELVSVASRHNLRALLFYAAQALVPEKQPDAPCLAMLRQSTKAEILLDARQQLASERILQLLHEQQLRAVVLKGRALKELYAKPEMRFTSDIDLWANPADCVRLGEALQQLGFRRLDTDAFGNDANVKVELHDALRFKRRHPAWTAYFAELQDAVLASAPCALTPEQHYLYLLCHYIMHFESKGIGLRQTLDLWLYRRTYTLDEAFLHAQYLRLGIAQFADNFERMLRVLFEHAASDALCDEMIAYVFDCGMYGLRKNAVARQLGREGTRSRYLRRRLFPPLTDMQQQYPTLIQKPVLLPAYWAARAIHGVFRRKQHLSQELRTANNASREQAQSLLEFNRRVGIPPEDPHGGEV